MPEASQILFSHKEVVELLLKKQNIHEGIWGLAVKFGFSAANIGISDADLNPAAIIPIVQVGLQRYDKESNIAVDAAKVNPLPKGKRSKK
jgi:hypothetical protein